jgi:uncharacterized membrane protein
MLYAYIHYRRPVESHAEYSSSQSISGHDSAYGSSRHGMSYGGILLKVLLFFMITWSYNYLNFHVNSHLLQVLVVVVTQVECTHQIIIVATCLVDLM